MANDRNCKLDVTILFLRPFCFFTDKDTSAGSTLNTRLAVDEKSIETARIRLAALT